MLVSKYQFCDPNIVFHFPNISENTLIEIFTFQHLDRRPFLKYDFERYFSYLVKTRRCKQIITSTTKFSQHIQCSVTQHGEFYPKWLSMVIYYVDKPTISTLDIMMLYSMRCYVGPYYNGTVIKCMTRYAMVEGPWACITTRPLPYFPWHHFSTP